jgi:hypothetical protein
MSGEYLAWAVTHINELSEAALLGGSLLPLLILAGIKWRQRRTSNASPMG